jgi:hypothetical protein
MGAAMLLASSSLTLAHAKPFMIVGLDEKTLWDADGKPFTPDGKRALAVRFPAHKISMLDVGGDKVTYNKVDLPTGQ